MMKDTHDLTFPESLDLWGRFALKLAAPPVVLWCAVHAVRTYFEKPTDSGSYIRPDATTECFLTYLAVFSAFWLVQGTLLRTPEGHGLFREVLRLQGLKAEGHEPPGLILLFLALFVFLAAVPLPALACSDIPSAGGRSFCMAFLTLWANGPLLYVLYKTTALWRGHRLAFIMRRNDRLAAIREAEERRRNQKPVVVPPTFESRLKRVTDEHQERVSQLKLLPIDEEERAYLIELEVARFREAIRSLTDPSFSPASHDSEFEEFPHD